MGRCGRIVAAIGAAVALAGCGGDGGRAWRVPAQSMLPTLKVGSVVISQSLNGAPKVGDIIVFHPPAAADAVADPQCGNPAQGAGHSQMCTVPVRAVSHITFIKRVVGLPGDRLALRNDIVACNGTPLHEPYITPCDVGDSCTFSQAATVAPGDYFVLGDNRAASDDSRFWGPVPRANIIGVVSPATRPPGTARDEGPAGRGPRCPAAGPRS